MPEETKVAPEETQEKSLVDGGEYKEEKPEKKEQTPEEEAAAKQAQEAEEKRLLEADPKTLSKEDQDKRAAIEKAREDKRLLDADPKTLSKEDQDKRAALVKAQEDAKKAAEKGAPENYTDFTVPDGIEINQSMLDEFKTLAKECDLSQERAQKLVDLEVKHIQGIADNLLNTFKETVTAWKKETVGELGADYKKEMVFAGKAFDRFGTPELRKILNQTGVGNHKEMVNFCIKVGKAISEDTLVEGQNRTGKKSDAELFYGESMKEEGKK